MEQVTKEVLSEGISTDDGVSRETEAFSGSQHSKFDGNIFAAHCSNEGARDRSG